MANLKDRGLNHGQPGGASIGSRQGGAPEETGLDGPTRPHRTGVERGGLSRNPDLDQADNSRGSQDQTQGSQTGNDIDLIPEP